VPSNTSPRANFTDAYAGVQVTRAEVIIRHMKRIVNWENYLFSRIKTAFIAVECKSSIFYRTFQEERGMRGIFLQVDFHAWAMLLAIVFVVAVLCHIQAIPVVTLHVDSSSIRQPAAEFDYQGRTCTYYEDYWWKIRYPVYAVNLLKDAPKAGRYIQPYRRLVARCPSIRPAPAEFDDRPTQFRRRRRNLVSRVEEGQR